MASPKICKKCRNIIQPGTKYCPVCGAKAPKGIPTWLTVILVIVAVIIMIGIIGGDKPEKVDSTPSSRTTAASTAKPTSTPKPSPTPEPIYTIGDTLELRNVRATLHDVRVSNGSQYNRPSDGMIFLVFEIEIENNTDTEIAVSSLLSFTAYADDYALDYSLSGLLEEESKQMDGAIAAGKKMRGVVVFDAPEDWQVAELHFKPNVWSGKEFVFVANSQIND